MGIFHQSNWFYETGGQHPQRRLVRARRCARRCRRSRTWIPMSTWCFVIFFPKDWSRGGDVFFPWRCVIQFLSCHQGSYVPGLRCFDLCGVFLSHGSTTKSPMIFSNFSWSKPSIYWGAPMYGKPHVMVNDSPTSRVKRTLTDGNHIGKNLWPSHRLTLGHICVSERIMAMGVALASGLNQLSS